MSRIFSKRLYVLFVIGVCLVCVLRVSAQAPSLAERVFQKYQAVFQREDTRKLLLDVLIILKAPDTQPLLQPATLKLIATNPNLLKVIFPEIDDRFLTLITEDVDANALINDPDVHLLLQNSTEIDRLLELLNALSDAAVVRIVPALIESPDIGEQFTLTAEIANAQDVVGYQATLQFDPEALQFVSWKQGNYLSDNVFVAPTIVEADRLSFAATALTAADTVEGDLFMLTFEVAGIKASTLSLSDVILASSEGTTLPVITQDSRIIEPITPPWDVNKDGVVNILDLTLVAVRFGQKGSVASDVNGDSVVNVLDLTLVASHLGE